MNFLHSKQASLHVCHVWFEPQTRRLGDHRVAHLSHARLEQRPGVVRLHNAIGRQTVLLHEVRENQAVRLVRTQEPMQLAGIERVQLSKMLRPTLKYITL